MTQAGVILGTAAYMSPEQAKGRRVDQRADVWAFGCVLFEMLTGQRAFAGEDVVDVLSRVLQREPDFDALPPMVPARVGQVLRACLRKDLKQRAHDMADVRLALEGAFETSVAQTATSVPVVARGRAREYLAWGLATVATLLAIGASVLYLRAPRQTDTIVRFTVSPPAGVVRPADAGFAVSPDGQLLAFVAKGADGVSRIFVRRLDAADAQVARRHGPRGGSLLGARRPVAGLRQRGRALSRRARRERPASAL